MKDIVAQIANDPRYAWIVKKAIKVEAARALGQNRLRALHNNKGSFAVLSAYREGEPDIKTKSENPKRHGELLGLLAKMGYKEYYDVKGYWDSVEKSILVPGMAFKDAIELGRKYNQDAIIFKSDVIGLYDLRKNVANIAVVGVDIRGQEDRGTARSRFRGSGMDYDFIWDESVPFGSQAITQRDLRKSGFTEKHTNLFVSGTTLIK